MMVTVFEVSSGEVVAEGMTGPDDLAETDGMPRTEWGPAAGISLGLANCIGAPNNLSNPENN